MGWTLLYNSRHSGCSGPGSRAGWPVASDLVPFKAVSSPEVFSTGHADVLKWEMLDTVLDNYHL